MWSRLVSLTLVSLTGFAACTDASGPLPPASAFRALPTVLNGPAVNAAVDGRTAITNLPFGQLSRTIPLSPGMHEVLFQPASGGAPYDLLLTTSSGVNYTAFVIDSAAHLQPIVVDDAAGVAAAGMGVLRVASYAALAPQVDVRRSQPDSTGLLLVAAPLGFGTVSGYFASTPGKWTVVVSHHTLTDTLLATDSIPVAAGQAWTVVLLDSAGSRVTWRLVEDRN
ncbi:MAG TPA: DUF4397 domain-containing protein [Gemmatimonadales bacterium]|nr:DUF4397 domain-containing protein [Gemmatimonadales bacterium]